MRNFNIFSLLLLCGFFFVACNDDRQEEVAPDTEVSPEILAKLHELGFKTDEGVFKIPDGYIVEGDIFLTERDLNKMTASDQLGIASEEQYHTDNVVSGTPRVIRVYVNTNFRQHYFDATDQAITRYNAEGLGLSFQRVTNASQADIQINPSPYYYGFFGILGSAGFPTDNGDPYHEILMTQRYYDNVTDLGALTTTIAHEMGHCIGFRHTDYMDRSYSCGGSTDNEGASDVGANHVPGTPTTGDPGSWMLACSDGTDRPFNNNDKIALDYLY